MRWIALFLTGIAALAQSIDKRDPRLDAIINTSEKIEKVAGGFQFTEGPLWFRDGYLLFSDVPGNVIYKWTPGSSNATEFRRPSGYDGTDAPKGAFIGSNGLTRDKAGNLIICEHGNGRVTSLDKGGKLTVLASRYEGKRLNSPNDAVVKSNGTIYFTDPPYGFPKQDDDPKKELKFNGVYRLVNGKPELLVPDMTRPNGLAFSPDEKRLYIANSDAKRKIWMVYDVGADGKLTNGKVFFDVTGETADGLPDGMKVDRAGNVFATGPGGVWIFSPDRKHLGTIRPAEVPANCHWGDDGKTLYMTARTGVYRVKVKTGGVIP